MINPTENIASIFMEALSENLGKSLLIQKNLLLPKLNYIYVAFWKTEIHKIYQDAETCKTAKTSYCQESSLPFIYVQK